MSAKVTDLPAGVAVGAVFYAVNGSTDSQVTGGAANGVATLGADGRVPSAQLSVDALEYKGSWNASTNTPALANGVGTTGDTYAVSVTGTQNLGGGSELYSAGDMLIYNGTTWDHISSSNPATPANPTATVALAAKNGTAPTFMRSDAAPAIDQAIVPTWTGAHSIITGADGRKLWLGKYDTGSGHNNAPSAIGAAATYMYVGGREYGNNGYGGIGFSYVADTTNHPAVWIGWQETNTAGSTSGDFIVATRPTTTNVAPTERLRVPAAGSLQVAGSVSAAVTTAPAGPTNTGVVISSAPNNADVVLFDSTQTVNNRTFEWINFQGKLQARFKNDAGSSAVVPLAFAGGQALGITGVESNSGSGAWAHTGAFSATGTATVLPAGGNGIVAAGTNSAGVPSIEATGAANDISLEIKAKAGGSIGFTGAAYLWAGTAPWTVSGSTGVPGQALMSTGNATAPEWSTPLPAAVASTALINQSADATNGTLYAVPADGTYRASCYVVLTRAATTSATLPGCNVNYTDLATNVAMTSQAVQSASGNVVGTHLNGSVVFEAKSGTNIGFATTGYASSGATTMQYRVRVLIERLL
ncbi:hypothetical protein [Mesorhizobium caraganae]|uniref:hypothetical protein n=1 Tax=Mesorhizobium caraganae TaxID=483206 RepID=UPI0017848758|nr:hypothetical protein [Mesorhizobium caraganae]